MDAPIEPRDGGGECRCCAQNVAERVQWQVAYELLTREVQRLATLVDRLQTSDPVQIAIREIRAANDRTEEARAEIRRLRAQLDARLEDERIGRLIK